VLVRKEAHALAFHPNGGDAGILAGPEAVGCRLDGVFGIGATALEFPGFTAHVADRDAPFLSDTGFRSFLGFTMPMTPGMTVESYIREAITHQVKTELKGQLGRVKARVAN
jgi:hypothetical protein